MKLKYINDAFLNGQFPKNIKFVMVELYKFL